MDAAALGVKVASSVVTPLVKRLFVTEGPGAGLVDRPVRVSEFVSFRGEKRALAEKELTKLAAELVRRAVTAEGERPLPEDETPAVVLALATTLHALGDLDMTDVQAVRLGHQTLALHLRAASGTPDRDLSLDATLFYERVLEIACLHILHFFTQRSTFVPRTLVEQTRRQAEIIAKIDELIARTPRTGGTDAAFDQRYLAYVASKHSHLTIYGIDLVNSPERWPLDSAYLSLQALRPDEETDARIATASAALPADQALTGHDRVLLRGVAGSGKTTLVQWLAVTAARGERGDRIPFVLPLRTLLRRPGGLPAPDAFLDAVRVPFHATQPPGWADRVLTDRRALLLVDGIDEIPEGERERTRRWLRDLLDVYPGNQWLVTSRPSAVREDWLAPDGFTELSLAPMSRDDVAAFVRRWHTAARVGAPDTDRLDDYEHSLLDAVRTKPDLGRLATNPLMCGLICALHRDRRGYLPHGRQELYEAALSMLLARRDEERDMFVRQDGIHLTEAPQIQLLQRLAYWLIRNNQSELDRERAERIIADVLPSLPAAASQGDAGQILRHLLVRSGLLREPVPDTVEFVHRTFQDYLGAKAAVEDGDFGLLVRGAADEQWADVIRMAVAHARPRERAELLDDLIASADGAPGAAGTRIRLLALASLEHATELDPRVRTRVESEAAALIPPRTTAEARALAEAGPLVLELLPGPEGLTDAEARAVVITASLIGVEAAIPVLARFRSHPSLKVRAQLMWTWFRFDTERYAEEVVAHLRPDGLYFTAHSVAHLRILRELGGPSMLQIVGDLAPDDIRAELRPDQVRRLVVRDNRALRDLAFVSEQGQLREFDLSGSPHVEDLAPLGGLPLARLTLHSTPGLEKPDALAPLAPTLKALEIAIALPVDSLDAVLPAQLEYVRLSRDALRSNGLRGLRHAHRVQRLGLASPPQRLTAEDFEEVVAMPALKELHIDWNATGWEAGPVLSRVTRLRLNMFTGNEDLSRLRTLFPGVTSLTLRLAPDVADIPAHVLDLLPCPPAVEKVDGVL
ncbi:NACHT domain-containing NTPase [Streptomyces sp. Ru72]|uniref:NACHT domain-containing protein n=1 Tax=Streptomyces sp. Ru72 TaxID=2080747 RepID=UPI000CDD8853|nr:NACHT domain-containing protein [Streptomyces sp. Ru72]POX47756.1 ATP-binding protein [Streptomyces sp. Ru72]